MVSVHQPMSGFHSSAPGWTPYLKRRGENRRQRKNTGKFSRRSPRKPPCLLPLQVWRRALPQVLLEKVMDPIGATRTWRWHGYGNLWVVLDGQRIQSVSGGGHWGGGLFISSRDQARLGYLFLRDGRWKEDRIISEEWIDKLTVPTPANPAYENAYWASGFGGNTIYVDPNNDLVVVLRWVPQRDGVISRVMASIESGGS